VTSGRGAGRHVIINIITWVGQVAFDSCEMTGAGID
jgi:hypothetical protein